MRRQSYCSMLLMCCFLQGFADADYALLVGAKPRGKGMERGDLLKDNGAIFGPIGKAMNEVSKKTCKTIVVGNPGIYI